VATRDLSLYQPDTVPSARGMKFGIVVSEWNHDITGALKQGAVDTLLLHGAQPSDIRVCYVPGSFELTSGAQCFLEYTDVDAVIALGCVIQGNTPHFTYICQGVTQGLTRLTTEYNIPVIFGVLTTDTHQQAADRAGGVLGNKGVEAAVTAIKMAALHRDFSAQDPSET